MTEQPPERLEIEPGVGFQCHHSRIAEAESIDRRVVVEREYYHFDVSFAIEDVRELDRDGRDRERSYEKRDLTHTRRFRFSKISPCDESSRIDVLTIGGWRSIVHSRAASSRPLNSCTDIAASENVE